MFLILHNPTKSFYVFQILHNPTFDSTNECVSLGYDRDKMEYNKNNEIQQDSISGCIKHVQNWGTSTMGTELVTMQWIAVDVGITYGTIWRESTTIFFWSEQQDVLDDDSIA